MSEWIDCKQELPAKDKVVLIAHWIEGNGGLFARELKGWYVWFAKYNDGWKRADGLSGDPIFHANVKCWKAMPEPPASPETK